jgi:tritrans,polycis-undecaprenyl-diphosphate synthase [geranylgeranyl-diphosphate specific]
MATLYSANQIPSWFRQAILHKKIRKATSLIPSHVAIILDGNRRWASKRSTSRLIGHSAGADRAEELLDWCHEIGIKTVTLYVLSTENLEERSPDELNEIFRLFYERFSKLLADERLVRFRTRVRALGRLDLLTPEIRSVLSELERKTAGYSDCYLNFAIAYGGRAELTDSVRKIAAQIEQGNLTPEEIDQDVISQCLYTAHLPNPDPDLVIRTSGEKRISGFLLWQSSTSQLLFLDKFWPDFGKLDLMRAVRTYQKRKSKTTAIQRPGQSSVN